jgi:hypothetical protein
VWFLRVTLAVVSLVCYAIIFSFGFFWGAMVTLLFSGSTSVFLIGGVVDGLFVCWFARGLVRNIIEMFDRDRSTWM